MAAKSLKDAAGKAAGTVGKATDTAGHAISQATKPPGELGDALRGLGQAAMNRAANSLTDRISSTAGRLTDFAAGNGSGGLLAAATGGQPGVKGKAMTGALKGALSGVAEKAKAALTGSARSKGEKIKLTNIVEEIDIGAPVDLVYDRWTQFSEFPSFMKKVENVEQVSDEKTEWRAQIFWSHRNWEATIREQVPYERIVWRSKGQKGHVDGAVTFHELTPDLTKVLLVLAYHPQGLFERTGNLWRAQGRRVRLELKHFRRQVMMNDLLDPDSVEGWHGEIRDSKVADGQDRTAPESDEAEDQPEDEADAEAEDEPSEDEEDSGETDERGDR
ncbi:SRPBCC family protein [Amycolatopsis benzoatilytica]|uniref:SRPBCC family protein n=1 Tax=Amycolatopsis benzoatilytica TaxID=346045 RepID=UPI0003A5B5FA|nr:SRPBCC family protein [Amycolatopsis benzoatilytica]